MTQEQLETGIEAYIAHLNEISDAFNTWALQKGVSVQMDVSKIINGIRNNQGLVTVSRFHSRADDNGIVHVTQLKTAIDCFEQLLNDQRRCGHVLGAMQSGKTTTSLALQWAGPVLYLLTGTKAYPFYLISNQTSHEDQTKTELKAFLDYYGDIEIKRFPQGDSDARDVLFQRSPSLNTYREHVLTDVKDVFNLPQLGDLIYRRVGGDHGIQRVVDRCDWAISQGYRPLMIIDEPQFGASSRVVDGEDGPERRPCVLAQMFDRIEEALGTERNDHWFIGLSATPFEINDLEKIWEVKQYLTSSYSGFNFFNGQAISPDVNITPPEVIGQSSFGTSISVPFLADVSMAAYHAPEPAFTRYARKINFDGDQAAYRVAVEDTLRETMYRVLSQYDPSTPVGLCIRALNNNARTEQLCLRLNLDPNRIEILYYYGGDASGQSIKRLISMRQRKDLPYVIFVTSRARMADAFPTEVRFFMDFGKKASDLNALLQGLLGRACGYGKSSRVVLSDQNVGIVQAYVATGGGYVHRTSRHSVAVGGYRRGAPTRMLKLRADMPDPIVERFFDEINRRVVSIIPPGSSSLRSVQRSTDRAPRTGPILTIATELALFDHIEQAEVRTRLFPQIPSGFRIARPGDEVRHTRNGNSLRYHIDRDGNCRYTFRWISRNEGAQGGAAGRAMGRRDATALSQHMEPTIYVEKFDPATGESIYDRQSNVEKRPGNWRAFMVTFPLLEPVNEIQAAEIALPSDGCVYDDWMTEEERGLRDGTSG